MGGACSGDATRGDRDTVYAAPETAAQQAQAKRGDQQPPEGTAAEPTPGGGGGGGDGALAPPPVMEVVAPRRDKAHRRRTASPGFAEVALCQEQEQTAAAAAAEETAGASHSASPTNAQRHRRSLVTAGGTSATSAQEQQHSNGVHAAMHTLQQQQTQQAQAQQAQTQPHSVFSSLPSSPAPGPMHSPPQHGHPPMLTIPHTHTGATGGIVPLDNGSGGNGNGVDRIPTPDPLAAIYARPPAAVVPLGWAQPTGMDAMAEHRLKVETLRDSLFGGCLSADQCASLAASAAIHACPIGARIFSQSAEAAQWLYVVARGQVRLEVWSDTASGSYAVGMGGAGGISGEDECSAHDLLGPEFLLGGNNLGTFLSPKHGELTRAEAQAAEAAAQAALAQKLEKAAREAHAARRAAALAAKEKERSDRLKQSTDMAFRAQAAQLITAMAQGALPGISAATPSHHSHPSMSLPHGGSNAGTRPPARERDPAPRATPTHGSHGSGPPMDSAMNSPSAGAAWPPESPASAGTMGGKSHGHLRNHSSSFNLPPAAIPMPEHVPAPEGAPPAHPSSGRPRIRSRHVSNDYDGAPPQGQGPGQGQMHVLPSRASGSFDFRGLVSPSGFATPHTNPLASNCSSAGVTARGGTGTNGAGQTNHHSPVYGACEEDIPDGPGTVRVCVKARGQTLGLCGFATSQQRYLSSAVGHSPGTVVVALPRAAIDLLLATPSCGARLRAHLYEALLSAVVAAPWLKLLSLGQAALLSSLFSAGRVPAGQTLFDAGECTVDSSMVYFLVEGAVDVSLTDERGRFQRKRVESGRWVGELAPVVGLCRTATAVTAVPCVVRCIQRRWLTLFYRLYTASPLAATAARSLLASYNVKDEQLLEQMDVQSAFGLDCLKTFSAENIEFWQTAVRFRKVIAPALLDSMDDEEAEPVFTRQEVLTEAALLYTRYISERSAVQINLKETVRASVLHALRSGQLRADTFLKAEIEIMHLMIHDNWARFKAGKSFAAACSDLEPPEPRPILPLPKDASLALQQAAVATDWPWMTRTKGGAAAASAEDAPFLLVEFRWGPPVGRQMGEMLFTPDGEVRTADNDPPPTPPTPPQPEPLPQQQPPTQQQQPLSALHSFHRTHTLPVVMDSPLAGPANANGGVATPVQAGSTLHGPALAILLNTPMGTSSVAGLAGKEAAGSEAAGAPGWLLQHPDEAMLGASVAPVAAEGDQPAGAAAAAISTLAVPSEPSEPVAASEGAASATVSSQLAPPLSPRSASSGGDNSECVSPAATNGDSAQRPPVYPTSPSNSRNAHRRRPSQGVSHLRNPSDGLGHFPMDGSPFALPSAINSAAVASHNRRASARLASYSSSNAALAMDAASFGSLRRHPSRDANGISDAVLAAALPSLAAVAGSAVVVPSAVATSSGSGITGANRLSGNEKRQSSTLASLGMVVRKSHSVHSKLKASPFNQQLSKKR